MNVALQEGGRPPHVEFYEDQREDRAASMAAGHYVGIPVDMVKLRQAGAKDSVDRNAKEWLESLPRNPNMLPQWIVHINAMYDQYKRGLEPTPNGTHVKMWPAASPSEIKTLVAAGILTVEDLAVANEPTLARIGMFSRSLQQKAVAWLDSAKTTGKTAAELDDLRVKVAQLAADAEQKNTVIAELRAQIGVKGARAVADEDDFLGTTKEGKTKK